MQLRLDLRMSTRQGLLTEATDKHAHRIPQMGNMTRFPPFYPPMNSALFTKQSLFKLTH